LLWSISAKGFFGKDNFVRTELGIRKLQNTGKRSEATLITFSLMTIFNARPLGYGLNSVSIKFKLHSTETYFSFA